jgi:hypothetical protein
MRLEKRSCADAQPQAHRLVQQYSPKAAVPAVDRVRHSDRPNSVFTFITNAISTFFADLAWRKAD